MNEEYYGINLLETALNMISQGYEKEFEEYLKALYLCSFIELFARGDVY